MWTLCEVVLRGKRMNFRQRMAWLFVVAFLTASIGIVYYIFEISDQYNALALEHSQNYDAMVEKEPGKITLLESLSRKLVSMPFWIWMIIFLLPYLQIFCVLIACTKSDPLKTSFMIVPLFVCMKMGTRPRKAKNCLNGGDMLHT